MVTIWTEYFQILFSMLRMHVPNYLTPFKIRTISTIYGKICVLLLEKIDFIELFRYKSMDMLCNFFFFYDITKFYHIIWGLDWILFKMNFNKEQTYSVLKLHYQKQSPVVVMRFMQKGYYRNKQLRQQILWNLRRF